MRAEMALIAAAFDKMPSLTGNAGKVVRVNAAETGLEASNALTLTTLALSTGAITPGTWTPTATLGANAAAATPQLCAYGRIGPFIVFGGSIEVDPTAGGALTVVNFSLPVASNLGTVADLRGVANRFSNAAPYISGIIYADTTNDNAILQFYNDSDTAARMWSFMGFYRVL